MLPYVGETHRCVCLKGGNGGNAIAMCLVKLKIPSGRLFQHPLAAILNYPFAQTTLFFQISNTKKEELKIIILVKFFFFSVRNLRQKCGLSEVIVKNGGGRMLEQQLPMSSALRARARSLGFLMDYYYYYYFAQFSTVSSEKRCLQFVPRHPPNQ